MSKLTNKAYLNDPQLEKLQEFEKTRGKLRVPPDIKPCIANLLDGSSPEIRDGINAFIIACELHRIGKNDEQIGAALVSIGVSRSKARSAVQSATTGKYNYGCPKLEELGFCLEKTRFQCWWFDKIARQSRKSYRERDFWRFGWPERLGLASTVIYLAIQEIEKKRRIYAGSWLFISRKELSKLTGVSPPWVIKCCERLEKIGLIKFKKGLQHRWYGKASEIKRIIPIPRM